MKYIKSIRAFENMNMSKSILKKKMGDYEKLKKLLSKNLGYIGKFTEYLFKGVLYEELDDLFTELIKLKNKSYPIDINNKDYEAVLDEIQETKEVIKINSFIKEFPSEQKSFIRELIKDDKRDYMKNIILKMVDKNNVNVFLSKISRYHDKDTLMNAMEIFSKNPMNDKKYILKSIEELKDTKVVYDNNNLLIVIVNSHENMKIIGSDTSWCIVGSKYQWSNYTNKGKNGQFILFNYNLPEYHPKFKIGFTIKYPEDTLTSAHDILDNSSRNELKSILSENNISLTYLNEYKHKEQESKISNIKLGSSLNATLWSEIIPTLSIQDSIKWLKKFIKYKKSESTRIKVIKSFLRHIFNGYKYVLNRDLEKIDRTLISYRYHLKNYVDTHSLEYSVDPDIFIELWNNGEYSDNTIYNSLNAYNFMKYFINSNKNKKIITDKKFIKSVFDKLFDLYNDPRYIKSYKTSSNRGTSYKNGLVFSLILLSRILNIEKSVIKDYDKIVSDNMRFFSTYNNIMGMDLDLGKIGLSNLYSKDYIQNVIKKDYDNIDLYISKINYTYSRKGYEMGDKLNDLLNHLKNNDITFIVNTNSIKNYNPSYHHSLPLPIRNILSEMKKMRSKRKLKNGDIISRGNVHIKYNYVRD